MIVAMNSRARSNHFARAITTLKRCRLIRVTVQVTHVQFAAKKWANIVWSNRFSRRVAETMPGSTKVACNNMRWMLDIFSSVRYATTQKCSEVISFLKAYSSQIGMFMCWCTSFRLSWLFTMIYRIKSLKFSANSDAKWEEATSNPFYHFEQVIDQLDSKMLLSMPNISEWSIFVDLLQHNAGPGECAAKHCCMPSGRRKCFNEDGEYLLVRCHTCGSRGVHECCMPGKRQFICDDCDLNEPPSKRRKIVPDESVVIGTTDDNIDENNNAPTTRANIVNSAKQLESSFSVHKQFRLKKFKIDLRNLTQSDIIRMTRNVEKRRLNRFK